MKGTRKLERWSRRRVLRGMLGGGAVTLGLPLLNCFLNEGGTALAAGAPLPLRFGTWFWGLGMASNVFVPKKTGAGFDLPEEIAALEGVRDDINVFTNFNAFRDSSPNLCHYSGWVISRTGQAPNNGEDRPGETIDVTIARTLGRTSRFRALTATATGDVRTTYSYENANSPNVAEASPLNFYQRVFGPDYQDPNAPTFTPNPNVMVRKSVLSGVLDQTRELMNTVGAEDRARLDQYFSSLRDLERQFEMQLTKPEPIAACHPVAAPAEDPKSGIDSDTVAERHRMLTDLLVMALACDQTRVFNMMFNNGASSLTRIGSTITHHQLTHEEVLDNRLGYQPEATFFLTKIMDAWVYFISALDKVKEGDRTLLDNTLILAHSETEFAKFHTIDNIPMMLAGRAGGRVKSGIYVDGAGSPVSRVGLTLQQVMGVSVDRWGSKSMETSKTIGELVA